jgi:hypothetical protein
VTPLLQFEPQIQVGATGNPTSKSPEQRLDPGLNSIKQQRQPCLEGDPPSPLSQLVHLRHSCFRPPWRRRSNHQVCGQCEELQIIEWLKPTRPTTMTRSSPTRPQPRQQHVFTPVVRHDMGNLDSCLSQISDEHMAFDPIVTRQVCRIPDGQAAAKGKCGGKSQSPVCHIPIRSPEEKRPCGFFKFPTLSTIPNCREPRFCLPGSLCFLATSSVDLAVSTLQLTG